MVKNGSEVPDPTVLLESFQAGQASVAQDDQTSPQTAQLGLTSSLLSWSAKGDRLVLVSLLSLKLVCTLTPSCMPQAFRSAQPTAFFASANEKSRVRAERRAML